MNKWKKLPNLLAVLLLIPLCITLATGCNGIMNKNDSPTSKVSIKIKGNGENNILVIPIANSESALADSLPVIKRLVNEGILPKTFYHPKCCVSKKTTSTVFGGGYEKSNIYVASDE